jgi:hypothetical protein
MIRECFKTRTGLIFDMDMLNKEVGMDIDLEHRRSVGHDYSETSYLTANIKNPCATYSHVS